MSIYVLLVVIIFISLICLLYWRNEVDFDPSNQNVQTVDTHAVYLVNIFSQKLCFSPSLFLDTCVWFASKHFQVYQCHGTLTVTFWVVAERVSILQETETEN